ncbi:MAG: alanine racemase [Flavobacteriaceae bacterium]|nr:alanine racemase [Flavobacteriaceae bacterium]
MNNNLTVLEINSAAVKHNLQYFKSKIQENTKILVVVKAFGYGSNAIEIAKIIQNDVAYFAVAYTHEGIALKNAKIKTPILVLHPQMTDLDCIIKYGLEPNLYSTRILKAFLTLADAQNLIDNSIHIEFNTGLNRLGFLENDIKNISSILKEKKTVKVNSIFSHLVASEDKNEREFSIKQIAKFENIANAFEKHLGFKPMMHITNTSGIINYSQAHFDMVRLGIGLYGFANDKKETSQLKNVMSLKSVISQIHQIEKGESIGYNRALIANNFMKTATIPIGHSDGIHRNLGKGKGFVTINNQKAFIVGNVCMDMTMIDITHIDCKEGDQVIIFNNQNTVEELAKISHTISYEVLTAISQRVKRIVK